MTQAQRSAVVPERVGGAAAKEAGSNGELKRELRGMDFAAGEAKLKPKDERAPTKDDLVLSLADEIKEREFEAWLADMKLAELARIQPGLSHQEYVVRKLRLEKARDGAREKLGEARQDFDTLIDPAATPAAMAEVRGRHGGGPATATSEATSHSLDVEKSYTRERTSTTVTQDGDSKRTQEDKSSLNVDVLGGSATYGTATSDVSEVGDEKKGTSDESSVTVSGDGVKGDFKTTKQDGDKTSWASGSAGLDRGDGKMGVSLGGGVGYEDAKDQLGGVSAGGKVKAGAIHGDEGDGTYSGYELDAKGGPASVSYSSSSDGRVKVEVTPIPGSEPPRFAVTTKVVVGDSQSAGVGLDFGKDAKVGGSASTSSTSAQETVRTRELSEAEKTAYMAQLEAAKKGHGASDYPELAAVKAGYSEGWDAAKKVANAQAEAGLDAAAAGTMKDGESFELNLSDKDSVGGKASLGAAGGGVGGSYTAEDGQSRKLKVEKQNGAIVMTMDVMDSEGWKAEGNASAGVAGIDYGEGAGARAGQSVTITLAPDHPRYAELVAELKGCTSRDALGAFAQRHPELVTRQVTTTGSSTSSGGNGSIGGHKFFGVNEKSDRQEQEITDADGKKSHVLTGNNESGGHLADLYKGNTKEALEVQVDSEGNAYGDLSETRTTTDAAGSAKKYAENAAKDPLAAASGGADANVDEVEVHGLLLAPDDFDAIVATAKADPTGRAWNVAGGVSRPAHVADWEACRRAIVAAGDDKVAVARALRDFVGTEKGGRYEVLCNLVRTPHSGKGGDAYELPAGLAQYKPAYRAVVQGDPAGPVRALVEQEKWGAASQEARRILEQLDVLATVIAGHAFDEPAVKVEMLGMVSQRKQEIERLSRRADAGQSGIALSDEELEAGDAWTGYLADFATAEAAKREEQALFAKLNEIADGEAKIPQREAVAATEAINKLRDVNAQHKKAYDALSARAEAHPDFAEQKPYEHLAPDSVKVKFAFDAQAASVAGQAEYGNPMSQEAEQAQDEADSAAELREADNRDMRESSLEAQQRKAANDAWKKQQQNQVAAQGAVAAYERQVSGVRGQAQRAMGKCNGCNAQGIAIKPGAAQKYSAGFAKYQEAMQHDGYAKNGLGQYVSAESAAGAVGRMVAASTALFQQVAALFKEGDGLQG